MGTTFSSTKTSSFNTVNKNNDLELHKLYTNIKDLCKGHKSTVDRLIVQTKMEYPAKPLKWIYEKVLKDRQKAQKTIKS